MKTHRILILLGLATLASGAYLSVSSINDRIGFPLDDAWIHQTYARNFARGEGWAFEAGEISGGATAPLWTLFLSIGYLLRINPIFWAFLLGVGFLWGVSIFAFKVFEQNKSSWGWLGLFFLFEWHFVWASVSGMETILAIFTVVAVFYFLRTSKLGWQPSLLLATAVWIRPDLLTLFLPMAVGFLLRRDALFQKRNFLLFLLIVFSLVAYLFFNQSVSGAWFPTTFYAKQAEYAQLRQLPLVYRLWQQFSVSLVGGGVFLLGGFLYRTYQSWKDKDWLTLSWMGWYLMMLTIYAVRLPVTYQHGRYIMPALGVYALIGVEGSILVYRWLLRQQKWGWVLAKAGFFSWLMITVAFWGLGGRAFAKDVYLIETQMVETAKWAEQNLPTHSRIAVHDIGAIGYFTSHDILDLAGLINPEVIPFIRDESQLAEYLDEQQVDYLICFPTWYPTLTKGLTVIYTADDAALREYNELPMTIYRWRLNNFISLWIE